MARLSRSLASPPLLGFMVIFTFAATVAGCSRSLDLPNSIHGPDAGSTPACTSITDEQACKARPDCEADFCQPCPGQPGDGFVGCTPTGAIGPACGGCVMPSPECSSFTDATGCNAAGCVSVYVDNPACECPELNCCFHFQHCLGSDQIACTANAAPACPQSSPCPEMYSPIYSDGCPIGCVEAVECANGGP